MNAADLARLELAKRAYKATEPRDAEVHTGVRRARLALTRPKARRAWFSKGLVLVVIGIGSLAYAKPQALGELVEKVLPREGTGDNLRLLPGAARLPAEAATSAGHALRARRNADANVEQTSVPFATDATDATEPTATATAGASSPRNGRANASPSKAAAPARVDAKDDAAATQTKPASATTDWGRVGQALARGDNSEALSALSELSESDDARTRDKADLGRAQLLMAHGEPDQACALARSLTHRRAGSRIERQAQLLLKSCGP
jgi:hypothetical protein